MKVQEYFIGKKKLYSCRFWYYKNGQKKSKYKKGFTGKKDAENWGIDEERRLKGLRSGAEKLKVGEFLDQWIKTKENKRSPSTITAYKNNIKHIKEHIGEMQLSKVKLIDVQTMLDELSEELRENSVRLLYRVLHAAFTYACANEYIDKNIIGVEFKPDDNKHEVKVYSAEDLFKLHKLLREQNHPLYIPIFLSSMRGLRRGECLGLRISDIDFDKEIAYIRNNYISANGKTYHRRVKTKESERIIDMSGYVASEIKNYIEKEHKAGRILEYLCEIEGELPDPVHVTPKLKMFQEVNKLPVCRFHDLRHSFAMLQIELGTDIDTLKRLMGHSNIGITSNTYLHQNISLIKKASAKLDNIIYCDKIVTFPENKTDDIKQTKKA